MRQLAAKMKHGASGTRTKKALLGALLAGGLLAAGCSGASEVAPTATTSGQAVTTTPVATLPTVPGDDVITNVVEGAATAVETIDDWIDTAISGPTTTMAVPSGHHLAAPEVTPGYAHPIETDEALNVTVGDCIGYRDENGNLKWDHPVACDEPHYEEVYFIDNWAGLFVVEYEDEGLDALELNGDMDRYLLHLCEGQFENYTGIPAPDIYGGNNTLPITYDYQMWLRERWETEGGQMFYCSIKSTDMSAPDMTRSWHK